MTNLFICLTPTCCINESCVCCRTFNHCSRLVLNLSVFSAQTSMSYYILNIIVFCHFNLMNQVFRTGDRSVPLLTVLSEVVFTSIKELVNAVHWYIWPESRCQSQTLILELSISLFYNIILNLIFVIHSHSIAFPSI